MLILEDEPVVARSLISSLRRCCAPTVCHTVEEAKVAIASHHWDAFLLDVLLPDGRGTDLLPSIREDHPTQPIVVMTGGDLVPSSHEALNHRAMFLPKPLPDGWLADLAGWLESGSLAGRLAGLGLTPRESELLVYLAAGATAEEAAARFDIEASTVRSHTYKVYKRLDARNLSEVIARADGRK